MMAPLSKGHPAIAHGYAAYTNQGFLLRETALVAELILANGTLDGISHEVLEEDLFQLRATKSRKTILKAVLDRVRDAPETLLGFLVEGSFDLRRLTNLYLLLLKHRLLREFIAELVWEELQRFGSRLSQGDIKAYFERKREQAEEVAAWSELTFRKSRHNILTICSDAGLLGKAGAGSFDIYPQVVPSALREELTQVGRASFLLLLLDRSGT